MKNNSPQKQAAISWIILMIGILLAVIGAMTAKEYRVNLCLLIGAMVVIGGIVVYAQYRYDNGLSKYSPNKK